MTFKNPAWCSMLALLLFSSGCFDLGAPGVTGVKGRLTVGPGVAFAERGILYQGVFERAGGIGKDGRFEFTLPSDGSWGLHLYIEDYIYLPIQVTVRDDVMTVVKQDRVNWELLCETAGMCDWVNEPMDRGLLAPVPDSAPENNPILSNAQVQAVDNGIYEASVEVVDPDGDLSPMVLVMNVETGIGVELNPPGPAVGGDYPDGVYRATIFVPEDTDPAGPWRFVAADHGCSNSLIIEVHPE